MTVKIFLDTNIVLYAVGQDPHKKAVARQVISASPMVSAQVINESVNVCLKKFKFDKKQAYAFADTVMNKVDVLPVDEAVIRKSAELATTRSRKVSRARVTCRNHPGEWRGARNSVYRSCRQGTVG